MERDNGNEIPLIIKEILCKLISLVLFQISFTDDFWVGKVFKYFYFASKEATMQKANQLYLETHFMVVRIAALSN